MPITIEIPEHLYNRIQKQAVPFVDLTPAAVIERWADFFDTSSESGIPVPLQVPEPAPLVLEGKRYNPMNPPELFHTRVIGHIGGRDFKKWNDLVRLAHLAALEASGSLEELRQISRANLRAGDHSGRNGFHFVPEMNASIQGLDAGKAWECAFHLAKHTKVPVVAKFTWRENPKAAFPGETGILEWSPTH